MATTFDIVPASGGWVFGPILVPVLLALGLAMTVMVASLSALGRPPLPGSEAGT